MQVVDTQGRQTVVASSSSESQNVIDTEKLSDYIAELDALKSQIVDFPQTFSDPGDSDGNVFNSLESIKTALKDFNDTMELLVANTSAYMTGRMESVKTKEEQHAADVMES